MKSYAHLAAKLFGVPLLLHQPVIRQFGTYLAHRIAGQAGGANLTVQQENRDAIRKEERGEAPFAARGSQRAKRICSQYGDIAVIEIDGVIDKALTDFEMECYGGVDLRDVDAALTLAAQDPGITRVVLAMNTPGGSTIGVQETAARIARLAETKEVHAYTDSLCCSAGMWLASQADHIAVTASAVVGSIGVFIAMLDESEALAMEGYKVELIKAGTFKAMGASFKPLSEAERQLLQSSVDATYDAFRAAITARRAVPQEAMEGQWYDGTQAAIYGVADEMTADSLDEYIAGLLTA